MSDDTPTSGPETTKLGEDDNGELVAISWPDGDVEQMLQASIASTPQSSNPVSQSPDEAAGPVARACASNGGVFSKVDLRTFSLHSTELATTLKRFRDEMYRNQFPTLVPSFTARCTHCGTEYDDEPDVCEVCENTDFEGPSKSQKHWFDRFTDCVNDDGQSLAGLMKYEEDYQSFRGVSTILVRLKYQQYTEDVEVAGRSVASNTAWEPVEIKELVHADPSLLVPVLDENNRQGGWWTCPRHRNQYWTAADLTFAGDSDHPQEVCPECQARLEEVGYAKTPSPTSTDVEQLYLTYEVIDWARHFPIRHGLDGQSPIRPLVKLQAILQWARNYDLQYLNPQNDQQLPDKFLVAYGKNIQESLRASLAENESKNPWEEGRLTYSGNPDDVEIELLDLSTDNNEQGREPMVERLMSQIRAMFGITDAFENELSDAGGLNAEGTQVKITNSAIAAAHQDTKDKALDSLCRVIERTQGHCDWELAYVNPESDEQSLTALEVLEGIRLAQQTNTQASVEDGQLQIPDQEVDTSVSPPGDGEDQSAPPEGASPPGGVSGVSEAAAGTPPQDDPTNPDA